MVAHATQTLVKSTLALHSDIKLHMPNMLDMLTYASQASHTSHTLHSSNANLIMPDTHFRNHISYA